MIKLLKYNFLMHFVPDILVQLIYWTTGYSLATFIYVLSYPINIFSMFFHLLHFMDLINIVSNHVSKMPNHSVPVLDSITMAIVTAIYRMVMYLVTELINLFFHDRWYWAAICLNFFILTLYHSFYCYNNFWQYKKIEMAHRIDTYEKLWPYYLGYGMIPTIIYLLTTNAYALGLYNMNMAMVVALAFLLEPKFPSQNRTYPAINLTLFSYLVGRIFSIAKYLTTI